MSTLSVVLGTVGTLFSYLILIFALQKLFSIGKDLSEIANILKEFQRERQVTTSLAGAAQATQRTWEQDVPSDVS